MIDRKRKGKRISAPKQEAQPSPVPDLMAALEESLAAAQGKSGGGRRKAPKRKAKPKAKARPKRRAKAKR